MKRSGPDGRVVGFIDIGTNSIRLMVVRLNPNHSYTILTRQKQQVRLGEGEFEKDVILPEAVERAVIVCKTFTELARTFRTEEFVAVATSAMREAVNQQEILHRLRQDAQLDIRVISGQEEARLIYLGVSSGMHLEGKDAFFIDIGGGSTEIAVGNERDYQFLESFKLGSIRLSNIYTPKTETGPITPERYKKIQQHVKNSIIRSVKKIRKLSPACAVASSGTAMNLAEIAHKQHPNGSADPVLTHRDLKKAISIICALSVEQRRKIPGINPERADIIVPGAVILDTFMQELALESIMVTGRGLQDGLLVDYLSRMDEFPLLGELTPRQRSVLQLGRACGINEVHARTVTALVLDMFDSAREQNLHSFGNAERELLEYATFLHDIGSFISYNNHQAHSSYIIKNSELLGFNQKEVNFMANLARYHRKKSPRKKDPEILEFDPQDREALRMLATFIRLGESLDRSHAALIQHVRFTGSDADAIRMEIVARGDCQLEIWGIESERKAFEKVLGKKIIFEIL
ncbi:MAG: Ppx/GppA phosphatase family protein [Methanomicrobiales archaeon]